MKGADGGSRSTGRVKGVSSQRIRVSGLMDPRRGYGCGEGKGSPTHLELQKEQEREGNNQGGSKRGQVRAARSLLTLPQSARLGNK